ncbi:adenylate kinase family protein [Caldivirga maquilingensis]|uniref:Nucleotide kinase-like protein n=1 Tax=Caldivirga maquilingensis (strain ATCC 700844 / DSM 13496 / JCM 10307 / IC-167) TaxID=397948 RepID=A8M8P8_CALMQ|nr:AAA family ATPase [Caldivirga maquilingensis]ABW02117.1 nucleotide kinase-like protein [Caldivirga maquilingensis IC-167]
MKILVTGVAKSGKSTILGILSELGYKVINASDLLLGSGCVKWNEDYQSFDITDKDCAADLVNKSILNCGVNCALESIAYELVDPGYVDLVMVIRRDPIQLYEEYSRLGWPCVKIFNNTVSEVTGSHVNDIESLFNGKVRQLVFTGNIDELRGKVLMVINNKLSEEVDWLVKYGGDERLHSILMSIEACLTT